MPTEANTGYGYLKKGPKGTLPGEYQVASFVEKPDLKTAQEYIESGDYLWNSGMFMFRAQDFLDELQSFAPDIATPCARATKNVRNDLDFLRVEATEFAQSANNSVDYALMEKTQKAALVPLNAGWSDVGSWNSLWEILEKDEQGNVVKGCEAIMQNTSDCMLMGDARLVTLLGIQDLVIIDTKDALLIAHKSAVQSVKSLVEAVKINGGNQHEFHRVVYRPWGHYDAIDAGERFQVKRITVKAGEKLSLQKHHHRAEHWVVVAGKAKVTRDTETIALSENESVYLPIGCVHALENCESRPLELIEVQVGSYLGEDDIVRFEDRYGR